MQNHFYQFPGIKLVHELKGHKKEVDDVTCHPDTHTVQNFRSMKICESMF